MKWREKYEPSYSTLNAICQPGDILEYTDSENDEEV